MSVTSTLHINLRGNAKQALEFYRSVFGGDLIAVPYGTTPSGQGPDQAEQIAWGQVLSPSGFHVMAYDVQDDRPYDLGHNPYYFSLRSTDAEEITRYWNELCPAAADVEVDLGPSIFSPLYGKLTDQFGVTWIIDVIAPWFPAE
ncbi:VOC family protein [Kineococcus sp. SYSU DK005]|uniref:VOC family protein n=1 Tax=Kineococcus sp. SYSU DK005 TaxID=3383126 RepID=UPI003D7CE63D